ncbi:hypothetical protein [Thalassotalea ganghwensis]
MKLSDLAFASTFLANFLLIGCSSGVVKHHLEPPLPCNGQLEVEHSVTIYSNDSESKAPEPKIKEICQPSVYPAETDFEKGNRRTH